VALQGTLDTFALPDVLRLLASTKKTGRLLVTGNRGTGSVWVDAGAVVGSDATGVVAESGPVDVLFELLRYSDGAFTFEAGTAAEKPVAARAVEPLLVDAERQLAEWREIEAVVPSMDAWVTLAGEIEGEEITIAAERWKAIVAIGSGTSVTGVGHALKLGELAVCRQVKELVELRLASVSTAPLATLEGVEDSMFGERRSSDDMGSDENGSGATWDPFAIEIPGVEPLATDDDVTEAVDATENPEAAEAVVSVVDEAPYDDELEADEVARQLASLSPKAAKAVAAAAKAATQEERDAALDAASDEDDEPINRGLLLKFLSSVKS
jgi:hypothetical protein